MDDNPLPNCNMCLGSSDPQYLKYNMAVSGIVLPIVGVIGLCGNLLVVMVYGSVQLRVQSMSIYLAALACSDFCMICTALILYVLEAWRHQGSTVSAEIYGWSAPYVFPISTCLQTTSVYYCVAAAADCFIAVVLPYRCKHRLCTPGRAIIVVLSMALISLLYNIPHFFELTSVVCVNDELNGTISVQICPTALRMNELYYKYYYTYLYTIFMAVGPLVMIVVLNACVVTAVMKKGASEDSDTISLILVVFMFIFCNAVALGVNFIEMIFADQVQDILVYLVDMSNLLVVINCTGNFFCYLFFGASFRRILKQKLHLGKKPIKQEMVWVQRQSLLNGHQITANVE
ncbi:hypothetical protein AB6A40_002229 [Gnathostoma spinigerum]|uniref:G-protein coupled receptors family 1 profile domain-containing protein n=1 Tax=Gnathostoma spinigerum TaxID=75299 RepID=A0ABD6E756_9BILA